MKTANSLLRFGSLALVILMALSLSSCALFKKKKPGYGGTGEDGDYVSGTPLPDRQEGVSFLGGNVDKSKFSPVYFAYDSFAVSDSEIVKLEQVASFLNGGGGTLIVAGFTDERGTEEYNRGLGERRALAVREYLLGKGVDASKVQTTSFGEEMPADTGGGDASWAKNRRAEFGLVR